MTINLNILFCELISFREECCSFHCFTDEIRFRCDGTLGEGADDIFKKSAFRDEILLEICVSLQ